MMPEGIPEPSRLNGSGMPSGLLRRAVELRCGARQRGALRRGALRRVAARRGVMPEGIPEPSSPDGLGMPPGLLRETERRSLTRPAFGHPAKPET